MTLIDPGKTDNRFVTWTDWDGYLKLLEAFRGRHVRITYDRGALELMTTSPRHELAKTMIRALLECLFEELELDFQGAGSTTFRRRILDRGLEPDECYYLGNIARILTCDGEDEDAVPIPDLAIEVEVSCSALNRMGIYAALGVPEVWRWIAKGEGSLAIHMQTQPGQYDPSPRSRLLPHLDPEDFQRHVRIGITQGQLQALRQFRAWVQKNRRRLQAEPQK
ncbi:MAG: Uma2 family endonuclease [Candidatus Xenobia bacterium]